MYDKTFNKVPGSRIIIVGVKYYPTKMNVGDVVELIYEPTNNYDTNAIMVVKNGEKTGYVGRRHTRCLTNKDIIEEVKTESKMARIDKVNNHFAFAIPITRWDVLQEQLYLAEQNGDDTDAIIAEYQKIDSNKEQFMNEIINELPIAGEIYSVKDIDDHKIKVSFFDHFCDAYGGFRKYITFKSEYTAEELKELIGKVKPINK